MKFNHVRIWKNNSIISFGEMIASPTKVGLCQEELIIKLGCIWKNIEHEN
jgi:hypothetical protein